MTSLVVYYRRDTALVTGTSDISMGSDSTLVSELVVLDLTLTHFSLSPQPQTSCSRWLPLPEPGSVSAFT